MNAQVTVKINANASAEILGKVKEVIRLAASAVYVRAQDRTNRLYPPASNTGDSPRRRSGDGRRSIFMELTDLSGEVSSGGIGAIVGTTSERLQEQGRGGFNYMAHWETHGRPWLLPALEDARPGIEAMIASRLGTP